MSDGERNPGVWVFLVLSSILRVLGPAKVTLQILGTEENRPLGLLVVVKLSPLGIYYKQPSCCFSFFLFL